ncbi:MAG: hypothetical protein ABW135_13285 [Thermoleophilaceae bacterium]
MVAGLTLAVLLCWVPGSQAAVYTGSATDPSGDLSLFGGDHLPDPPTNFTNVAVRFDDAAGRVDVSYTFNQAPASYQQIHAGVGFGTTLANGDCNAPFFSSLGWHVSTGEGRGESAVQGHSTNFTGNVTGSAWTFDDEASWDSTSFFEWSGNKRTWNFATTNGALVGKHYNCATAAMWLGDFGGPGGPTDTGPAEDFLESGNGTFLLSPVVPAAPTAKWQNPKDGQTVSGTLSESSVGAQKCAVATVGPVVRTENYVDGKLNDTQVFAPWACEWDTRNYVNGGHLLTVKAYDAANNVIAADTIRVTVNNPNPPLVDTPPPPITESAPTTTSSGQPGKPALRFTRQKARAAVKKVLARRYGKAFRKRKGYVAVCAKASASRWNCKVRWHFGQVLYKGSIKLTLRSDGRVASRALLRKTIT